MRRTARHLFWLPDLPRTPAACSVRVTVEDLRERSTVEVRLDPTPGITCSSCDSGSIGRPERHCMHACWLLLRVGGQLSSAVFDGQCDDHDPVRATYANLEAMARWRAALIDAGLGSRYTGEHYGREYASVAVAHVDAGGHLVATSVDLGASSVPQRTLYMPRDTSEACPICLDPLGNASCTACEGCRNAFHRRCVGRWGASCPICRDPDQFASLTDGLNADLRKFVDGFGRKLAGDGPVPRGRDVIREIVMWL